MTPRECCLVLALAPLVFCGCSYTVWVAGERNVEQPADLDAGVAICVRGDPAWGTDDPEVARKLEGLLRDRKYDIVTDPEQADYVLLFEHSVEALLGRSRLQFSQGAHSGMETVREEGPFNYSLSLRVVKAAPFLDDGDDVVWRGGAVMPQAERRTAANLDAMIVATMQDFPADTGGTVRRKIQPARAKKLDQY